MKSYNPPIYHLEKPLLTQAIKESALKKLEGISHNVPANMEIFHKANSPDYLYWDHLKYKQPPAGLSSEEWWYFIQNFRLISAIQTPLLSQNGKYFGWIRLPYTDEFLHEIDMHAGWQTLPQTSTLTSPANRQMLVTRGIIEEAIASSQLEGAHTTRKVAKQMILDKRAPRNESERMIFNNYQAIMAIEEKYKNDDLSVELLFELHKILTDKTINPQAQGRFRRDDDQIIIQGQIGSHEYTSHVPPSENFIKEQIIRLINYANDAGNSPFIHPIIKAIFLHFWIGYLHPFTDGNGRLARAIFYWYLLKKGYWTFMYLPISTVIKKAPLQYAMAYIYTEQDRFDLTYFYDFHMKKIMQALAEFKVYIQKKKKENIEIDLLIKRGTHINLRQKQLIYYLLSENNGSTTIASHRTINNISRQTAAKDLEHLEKAGFLSVQREGKQLRYFATDKLQTLLVKNHN